MIFVQDEGMKVVMLKHYW